MAKRFILVLGGARSGKSRFAQEAALQVDGKVLFVATGEALDEEMRERIEVHKRDRPPCWCTIEVATGVGRIIREHLGDSKVVIIDCITLLVSNVMRQWGAESNSANANLVEKGVTTEIKEIIQCIKTAEAIFILVSNEVGMGLVPDNRLGRLYRDLLGKANQELAHHADEVYFLVAGIALNVKPARGRV